MCGSAVESESRGYQSFTAYVCDNGTFLLCVHDSLLVCLHIPISFRYIHTSEKVWTGPILYRKSYSCIPRNKLLCLVPNSYIHVSVSAFYISRIGLPIWLQQNRQSNPGNIWISHRYMNVEIGRQNIIILFWQFHFWEYINRNQTFISDSHRPLICI